jgi:hypothetical protein
MKKTTLLLMFLGLTVSVMAQRNPFHEGTWFINPSLTGLDFSYSQKTKVRFAADVQVGAFIVDDFALLVKLGGEVMRRDNRVTAGVGARYYFMGTGLYMGAGLDLNKRKDFKPDFGMNTEVGFAFFLSRRITMEPGVYYNWNFRDGDYSKFGLKIGFGLYF